MRQVVENQMDHDNHSRAISDRDGGDAGRCATAGSLRDHSRGSADAGVRKAWRSRRVIFKHSLVHSTLLNEMDSCPKRTVIVFDRDETLCLTTMKHLGIASRGPPASVSSALSVLPCLRETARAAINIWKLALQGQTRFFGLLL